jgi:DNA-binding transcriptional ArsR family regulator
MVQDAPIPALKAMAHPLRWRILATLASGERNVGEIEQVTAIAQPGLSQQLGVLRKAGLVLTRKDAKLVFYSISQEAMADLCVAMAVLCPIEIGSASEPEARPKLSSGAAHFARVA